jgi:uncharacterized protein YkwD
VSARTSVLCASAAITLAALACSAPAGAQSVECRDLADDEAVVCEINHVRAERGLGALAVDRRLRRAAVAHVRDMVSRRYFSHVTPEGKRLPDRLRASGYITGRAAWHVGEGLAWGRRELSTPSATVAAWMRSAPHRRIVLGAFLEIGVGVARGVPFGGRGATYAADFGRLGG